MDFETCQEFIKHQMVLSDTKLLKLIEESKQAMDDQETRLLTEAESTAAGTSTTVTSRE
jgi:hypothetical protein